MKKTLMSVFLVIIMICQTGCWDMEEINEMGMVVAVGIDFSRDTNKFTVTVEVANSMESEASSKKGGGTQSEWIGTAEGVTIFEAVRALGTISSKHITWAHNTIIIIGEGCAKNDITPVVDFFTHNPQLRMKTSVVVSKGNAKNYIASKAGLENLTGISLAEMARLSERPAMTIQSEMLSVNAEFAGDYSQILIGGINFEKSVLNAGSEGDANPSNTIALEGAAVFKKNKMVGWLSPEEARGIAWILNKTDGTLLTVQNVPGEISTDGYNTKVSVETAHIKSKIKSIIVDGIPNITIYITGYGHIVEEDGVSSLTMPEFKQNVQKSINKQITNEIEKGLDKVQSGYKSDVLGFAKIVEVQNDETWRKTLNNEWVEVFPNIPVKIQSQLVVDSNTLNQEPTRQTKGK